MNYTTMRIAALLILGLAAGQRLPAQLHRDASVAGLSDASSATTSSALFTRQDAALAGGFAALTVAMFPLDHYFATRLNDPQSRANKFLNRAATGFELIATPGSFVIGGSLYAYGRLAKRPSIAELGWHGTEAILIASTTTTVLKGLLGRARPYATADTNPRDFQLGKGFSSRHRQSFPSGHSTTAFAAAAAVTTEVNRNWPRATWVMAPVMFGGATMVGLSRMYHDQHWASDVVLGAAVGTFAGLKIVRYAHAHPTNALDRAVLGSRQRLSIPIGWSIAFP